MHIVFVVGSYYPYYSAVGKCAGNIASELGRNNKITIICLKNFNNQNDRDIFNNQQIIRVNTEENQFRSRINQKITSKNSFFQRVYSIERSAYKLLKILSLLFSKETLKKQLVRAYYRALKEINEPIDLIIPVSMPIEAVVASIEYNKELNNKVKIIPYLFDQFVNSATLHRGHLNKFLKRRRHLIIEKEMILHSSNILAMHSLKKHFDKEFAQYTYKFRYVEHPLIIEKKSNEKKDSQKLVISYVGGLYKNYVTPEYLLEVFKRYSKSEVNATLNFYIIGNCDAIVNKYVSDMPKEIINHGSVEKKIAENVILDSDILISIAEKNGVQMSSKIFEYISAGKPIVHFYSDKNDVNLSILKKYPLCLCIKQDVEKIDENITSFKNFCEKYKGQYVSYNEVEKIFSDATPKNTADLFLRLSQ